MNWNQLKNKIYFWDGSWLDIYVHDTTQDDWKKWSLYVNQNYRVEWYNGKEEKEGDKIEFEVIQEFWNGNHDLTSTAKVFIDCIQINAHFFDDTEIENDIDPREFKSIEDHNKLIRYLKDLSEELQKEVTVTPENRPEIILMKVFGKAIEINLDREPNQWPVKKKE